MKHIRFAKSQALNEGDSATIGSWIACLPPSHSMGLKYPSEVQV
jgi:hypothetical protein